MKPCTLELDLTHPCFYLSFHLGRGFFKADFSGSQEPIFKESAGYTLSGKKIGMLMPENEFRRHFSHATLSPVKVPRETFWSSW